MAHRPRFPRRLWCAAILFIWVNAYLWLLDQDRYVVYLRPSFWWLIGAGLVFSVFLLFAVLTQGRRRKERGISFEDLNRGLILILPVVYLPLNQGATLGSFALERRAIDLHGEVGISSSGPATKMTSDTANRAIRPPVMPPPKGSSAEHLPLFQIRDYFKYYETKEIVTRGMVFSGKKLPPGHFVAFQFKIVCCAADAVPVAILTKWDDSKKLKKDQWVEIRGILGRTKRNGKAIPMITAKDVKVIEKPKNPYGF